MVRDYPRVVNGVMLPAWALRGPNIVRIEWCGLPWQRSLANTARCLLVRLRALVGCRVVLFPGARSKICDITVPAGGRSLTRLRPPYDG